MGYGSAAIFKEELISTHTCTLQSKWSNMKTKNISGVLLSCKKKAKGWEDSIKAQTTT